MGVPHPTSRTTNRECRPGTSEGPLPPNSDEYLEVQHNCSVLLELPVNIECPFDLVLTENPLGLGNNTLLQGLLK